MNKQEKLIAEEIKDFVPSEKLNEVTAKLNSMITSRFTDFLSSEIGMYVYDIGGNIIPVQKVYDKFINKK